MDLNDLLVGDIILYRDGPANLFYQRGIGAVELLLGKGNEEDIYEHASISIGDGKQVEAVWPKARISAIDPNSAFDVFRILPFDQDIANKATQFALGQVGKGYDWMYFMTLGLIKERNKNICSYLVWNSYKQVGFDIEVSAKFVTPEVLGASTSLLKYYTYS